MDTRVQDSLSDQVAEEIRALMARRRLSGRQMAAALHVSPAWISYRLTGTQEIGLNDLQRIAEVLEVTIADLLPRSARVVTNGSSPTLADTPVQPHPVDVRSGVGHQRHRRTGRTGRSLQHAISHSPAVA